jgi:homoserine kinase
VPLVSPDMPPHFVTKPVRVRVPATSANLGPGYDCLGISLDIEDHLEAEITPAGLEINVSGEGADGVSRDESHLVLRAMRKAFEELGAQPPGIKLNCHNQIPHGRGMGSSSAAIVGGLLLGRALVVDGERHLDQQRLLELATQMEGHPDNVAPAILGGFVVSGQSADTVWATTAQLSASLDAVVFIPSEEASTHSTRALLPETVDHADAAANTSRAALLVVALGGQPQHLMQATEDFLHQNYRASAMPDSLALVNSLREQGFAAVISGAGPTVLCFNESGDDGAAAIAAMAPAEWRVVRVALGGSGGRVLS